MTATDNLPWEDEADAADAGGDDAADTPRQPDPLALPSVDALDEILSEQAAFDAMLREAGEFSDGELGKTALESRAEIPALARLHHHRRVLARALAPIAALFEGGRTPAVEAKRKQHRQVIGTLIAKEQGIAGDKQEARLERLANADPRHLAFCEHLDALRVKYYLGRVALLEVNEEIRDREQAQAIYNAELRAGLRGGGEGA